jgi:LemA protein
MDIPYGLVALVIAAVLLVYVIVMFNRLVALRNRMRNGWAEIDVQLKRRHDLIPSLVETARAYMEHERSTLEAVVNARARAAVAGNDPALVASAEGALTGALSRFFGVVERYPQLRAVESMQLLAEQLTSTEHRIAFARQFYNDSVLEYNTALGTFPRNLIAAPLGFAAAALFSADEPDKALPQVHV